MGAVFFAARHAEFDFEGDAERGHAFQITHTNFNVFMQRLLAQVEHVAAKKRAARRFKIFFIAVKHSIHPINQFQGAMVGVQNHRHAVMLGHRVDVRRTRCRADDSRAIAFVGKPFSSIERRAAVGILNNDGRIDGPRRFQNRIHGTRTDDIHGWQRVAMLFCVGKNFGNFIAMKNARPKAWDRF